LINQQAVLINKQIIRNNALETKILEQAAQISILIQSPVVETTPIAMNDEVRFSELSRNGVRSRKTLGECETPQEKERLRLGEKIRRKKLNNKLKGT
jgi:hypothetical protein